MDSIDTELANTIRQDIIEGTFEHGARITEAKLCDWHKVSRTPVRLALRRLEQEGMIRKGEGQDTSRHNIVGTRYRYWRDRWFTFGNVGAQQNEELGLNLRVFASGGGGRFSISKSSDRKLLLSPSGSLDGVGPLGVSPTPETMVESGLPTVSYGSMPTGARADDQPQSHPGRGLSMLTIPW